MQNRTEHTGKRLLKPIMSAIKAYKAITDHVRCSFIFNGQEVPSKFTNGLKRITILIEKDGKMVARTRLCKNSEYPQHYHIGRCTDFNQWALDTAIRSDVYYNAIHRAKLRFDMDELDAEIKDMVK